jgi:pilus assembly protein CpaE
LFLEVAEALGYPSDKMVLVLNRAEPRSGISAQDIQRSINHPIAASIVSDSQVVLSAVNRGVPFVIGNKDSQIARNVQDVAHLVAGWTVGVRPRQDRGAQTGVQPAKKRGILDWLLGR